MTTQPVTNVVPLPVTGFLQPMDLNMKGILTLDEGLDLSSKMLNDRLLDHHTPFKRITGAITDFYLQFSVRKASFSRDTASVVGSFDMDVVCKVLSTSEQLYVLDCTWSSRHGFQVCGMVDNKDEALRMKYVNDVLDGATVPPGKNVREWFFKAYVRGMERHLGDTMARFVAEGKPIVVVKDNYPEDVTGEWAVLD